MLASSFQLSNSHLNLGFVWCFDFAFSLFSLKNNTKLGDRMKKGKKKEVEATETNSTLQQSGLPRGFNLFPEIHSLICIQLLLPCKRSQDVLIQPYKIWGRIPDKVTHIRIRVEIHILIQLDPKWTNDNCTKKLKKLNLKYG